MPFSLFTCVNTFAEDIHKAVHNFTDDTTCDVTIALCNAANAPAVTMSDLTDLTQIAYTNLSTRVVTGIAVSRVDGVTKLEMDDLTLLASGGDAAPFRYLVFYNAANDRIMGWIDYGADLTMTNGQSILISAPEGIETTEQV
jgi:hypothetical protein